MPRDGNIHWGSLRLITIPEELSRFNRDKALLKFQKTSVHEKRLSTLRLLYLITLKLQALQIYTVHMLCMNPWSPAL